MSNFTLYLEDYTRMNVVAWNYKSEWLDVWHQTYSVTVTYISWSCDFDVYFKVFMVCEHDWLG